MTDQSLDRTRCPARWAWQGERALRWKNPGISSYAAQTAKERRREGGRWLPQVARGDSWPPMPSPSAPPTMLSVSDKFGEPLGSAQLEILRNMAMGDDAARAGQKATRKKRR